MVNEKGEIFPKLINVDKYNYIIYCKDPLVKPATLVLTHPIKDNCQGTLKKSLFIFTLGFILRNCGSKL